MTNNANLPAVVEADYGMVTASPAEYRAHEQALIESGNRAEAEQLWRARLAHRRQELDAPEETPATGNPYVSNGALNIDKVWQVFDGFDADSVQLFEAAMNDGGGGLQETLFDAVNEIAAGVVRYPRTIDAMKAWGFGQEVIDRFAAVAPNTRDALAYTKWPDMEGYTLLDHPALIAAAAARWRARPAAQRRSAARQETRMDNDDDGLDLASAKLELQRTISRQREFTERGEPWEAKALQPRVRELAEIVGGGGAVVGHAMRTR